MLVDNQKCQAWFRPLCNKILFLNEIEFWYLRRGIVPYFFVTVTVIVTVIMILAMFIFYFCLKQQDKHCIRHYDCDYDCDYDKKIRYKYGPLMSCLEAPLSSRWVQLFKKPLKLKFRKRENVKSALLMKIHFYKNVINEISTKLKEKSCE